MATNPDLETDIPNEVYTFLKNLNSAVDYENKSALKNLYENQFDALTRSFYIVGPGQFRSWPSLRLQEVSSHLVNPFAIRIYGFLFSKHLFTDRMVKAQDAKQSWGNFVELFKYLSNSPSELPSSLLWDFFDEFVYQMTTVYQKHHAEAAEWSVVDSFRMLDTVMERSNILRTLASPAEMEDLTKQESTIFLSGFFAILTKAKLHVLLGDYYAALTELKPLDIYGSGRQVLQRVVPASISLFYHVGFCYLMLHRYEDASNCFTKCSRTKNQSSGAKFSERVQMDAAYMDVCARVLGGLHVAYYTSNLPRLRNGTFEDDKESLKSGDEERFREVFDRCSPKFLTVVAPSSTVKGTEGKELQARMFRRAVQQQQDIIKLRGYFGVYQNTKISLVEALLETEDGYAPLFAQKMRARQLVHDGEAADLMSGKFKVSSQFDCIIEDDNVEVVQCTNFGGAEVKLLKKIEYIQREQRQTLQYHRQRQEQQERRARQEQQQQKRGNTNPNRNGQAKNRRPNNNNNNNNNRAPRAQALPASESLMNRNE